MAVQADTAQALVDAIFLFGRSLKTAITSAVDDPLAPALAAVLFVLSARGPCRQNELASVLCVSQSALSRQMTELVDAGLVDRQPDSDDKRAFLVQVSEKGDEVLRTTKELRSARLHGLLGGWSQEEAVAALSTIERLTDTLAARNESAPLAANHSGRALQ
ncbi:MarR family transcriptional regulator [Rhodococcus sp. TAF43]|uniref:MarR family winged helix-turn-helix transcriptional regulator n=1 Tax=unclassified Rhodococcus (in: high G+C Gram-positive bacteria) TaxID=192944 RepID=UPI000E0C5D98|nr:MULTISPECIES: MarR family transcriptional regulator [unclassified Rhodococcus (in: high G+C Gram-positive bacteria)]QKT11299.1 MarR family transcriptional regulator [Rhodococcus sp. W8901]RDI31579.1 MarR family transcriptional regulator [Rhodococcus sp. AG1013]